MILEAGTGQSPPAISSISAGCRITRACFVDLQATPSPDPQSSEAFTADSSVTGAEQPGCERVEPTANAVLFWPFPQRWQALPEQASPYTLNDVWTITLCRLPTPQIANCANCDAVVQLRRTLGCQPLAAHFSNDPRTVGIGHKRFGPDELTLIFEGPEQLSSRPRYLGNCTYQYSIHVTIPGTYRLFVVAQHADWGALDETARQFKACAYSDPFCPCQWHA